jgi:hypothetical protein
MTVAEHHIGQLYTVAKQSIDESNESKGGTAVEILENGPFYYTDDMVTSAINGSVSAFESSSSTTSTSTSSVGDISSSSLSSLSDTHSLPATPLSKLAIRQGQFTKKVYHVGGHIPGWMRTVAPVEALKAEEKAWNCYPYCRTVLTNNYLGDRFHVIIETLHVQVGADGSVERKVDLAGSASLPLPDLNNVFMLPEEVLKNRQIYHLDICKGIDRSAPDYKPQHDPTLFRSSKTGRGPFTEDWSGQPRMLVYKLVTVRTAIFGIQSRAESLILEVPN